MQWEFPTLPQSIHYHAYCESEVQVKSNMTVANWLQIVVCYLCKEKLQISGVESFRNGLYHRHPYGITLKPSYAV